MDCIHQLSKALSRATAIHSVCIMYICMHYCLGFVSVMIVSDFRMYTCIYKCLVVERFHRRTFIYIKNFKCECISRSLSPFVCVCVCATLGQYMQQIHLTCHSNVQRKIEHLGKLIVISLILVFGSSTVQSYEYTHCTIKYNKERYTHTYRPVGVHKTIVHFNGPRQSKFSQVFFPFTTIVRRCAVFRSSILEFTAFYCYCCCDCCWVVA